jgi:hypothetical protein
MELMRLCLVSFATSKGAKQPGFKHTQAIKAFKT